MKRLSKLHFGDIGKSFSASFVLITIVWCLVSYYSVGVVHVSWQILLGNLAVAAMLSAVLYRLRYQRVLEYDKERFILRIGQKITEGKWKDFSFVSLYHRGFGIFAIRLYRESPDETDLVELPATDLGLNPWDMRFELLDYL